MKIEKIDKNFSLRDKVCIEGDRAQYNLPHSAFSLYGIFYDEKEKRFVRMDLSIADSVSEGVGTLSRHTAGGRLRFATDSSVFQLTVKYDFLWLMSHMPLTGSSGFSLFEETDKGEMFIKNLAPISSDAKGFTAEIALKGDKVREYILYFPLYNDVKSVTISLDKDAQVKSGKKYREELPILYYGSSITQGGCASRPDHAYQAMIAKRNNIDFINLGFSGSAKGEDIMVDYLAGIECGLFVCDYDHNAPTAAHLKNTHYSHITDTMRLQAAVKIDREIGGVDELMPESKNEPSQTVSSEIDGFIEPYKPKIRKSGTGCITMINEHLYEGRYSPKINGKRMARNVYAKTREECEEQLAELIKTMKAEIAELKKVQNKG